MISPVMLRRIAIAALLIAFFLPLSKCSWTATDGSVKIDYEYPVEFVVEGAQGLPFSDEPDFDAVLLAVVTLAVFFLPLAIITMKTRTQSLVHVVLAAPAEWLLYLWATIGDPQAGGFIAMTAWGVLFITGVITLMRRESA
jgi:hypothetical protein